MLEILLILVPPIVIGFILLRCGMRLLGAILRGLAMSIYTLIMFLIAAVGFVATAILAIIAIVEAVIVRPVRLRREAQIEHLRALQSLQAAQDDRKVIQMRRRA